MFVKFYVLVALVVASESGYQNSRYNKNGNRVASSSGSSATGSSRGRVRACAAPRLANGFVTPLYKGKMMRFDCNKGFSRLGERYAECSGGRWSIYTFPICIKSGCPAIITTPDNGKITYLNAKASAMLHCEPNYESVGNSYAHCNGTHWDRDVGTCRETDNTPPTSCDFESESICGWTSNPDHDFEFERRSGCNINSKTIALTTGPQADHTTKIPFQGHYMVINTNTEVFTKRAHLISPLFKIPAQTLCFKFFYFMYGVNLGTLRVYMKPESVEMQDVILDDIESEARNEYVVFEIKGSQGSRWIEGGGFMKTVNESFQIIIEAVSGQTRLSDIAFDDISILTDDECADDEDERSPDFSKDFEDLLDSVFSVDSCSNRCFEDGNSTVQLSANHSLSCSCSRDCEVGVTCCPDFIDICFKNATALPEATTVLTTTAAITTTTMKSTTTTTTSELKTSTVKLSTTTTQMPTILSTTKTKKIKPITTTTTTLAKSVITSSTPPSTTPTTTMQVAVTKQTQRASIFNQTDAIGSKTTKSLEDYDDVGINVEGEDEHDMELDDLQPIPSSPQESDNIVNERFMMNTKSNGIDITFIIKALLIAISTIFVSFFVFLIVYKQYKKSTNPLNYKEKHESGSRKANEEFSEIRYLTSDEILDFNLASPDTTDL